MAVSTETPPEEPTPVSSATKNTFAGFRNELSPPQESETAAVEEAQEIKSSFTQFSDY